MNGFGLNTADLNGPLITNHIVVLGTSSFTLSVDAYEKVLSFLPATAATFSVETNGSIVNVLPIAPTNLTFNVDSAGTAAIVLALPSVAATFGVDSEGTLHRLSSPGAVSLSLSLDSSGVLGNWYYSPAVNATFSIGSSGSLSMTGGLAANASLGVEVSGALQKVIYLDPVAATYSIETIGDLLRATKYMSASAALDINSAGTLYNTVRLGNVQFPLDISLQGGITVNASVHDSYDNTLIRAYQERTMVR